MSRVKIAVISDIHGNYAALEAVLHDCESWQPDLTLVAGDIVNGGPQNVACWLAMRERQQGQGWHLLRGNHEDYVVEWLGVASPRDVADFELRRLSYHTYTQLGDEAHDLAALPDRFGWRAADGSTLLVVHASILGNRQGIYPWSPAAQIQERIAPYPTVFVTAHTHVPFQRQVGETLLVNVGSVGLPGDGDSRASYGRLTWSADSGWQASVQRVGYDRAATEAAYFANGFLEEAGPSALMSLVELRTARDAKTRWAREYQDAILAGQITVAESVRQFLSAPEFAPFLTEFTPGTEIVSWL